MLPDECETAVPVGTAGGPALSSAALTTLDWPEAGELSYGNNLFHKSD